MRACVRACFFFTAANAVVRPNKGITRCPSCYILVHCLSYKSQSFPPRRTTIIKITVFFGQDGPLDLIITFSCHHRVTQIALQINSLIDRFLAAQVSSDLAGTLWPSRAVRLNTGHPRIYLISLRKLFPRHPLDFSSYCVCVDVSFSSRSPHLYFFFFLSVSRRFLAWTFFALYLSLLRHLCQLLCPCACDVCVCFLIFLHSVQKKRRFHNK